MSGARHVVNRHRRDWLGFGSVWTECHELTPEEQAEARRLIDEAKAEIRAESYKRLREMGADDQTLSRANAGKSRRYHRRRRERLEAEADTETSAPKFFGRERSR